MLCLLLSSVNDYLGLSGVSFELDAFECLELLNEVKVISLFTGNGISSINY